MTIRKGISLGSKVKEKLLALCGLVWFSKRRGIHNIYIVGDSKAVIKLEKDTSKLQVLDIKQRENRVRMMIERFSFISFLHIFREVDSEDDRISKLVVGNMDGIIPFEDFMEDIMVHSVSMPSFY